MFSLAFPNIFAVSRTQLLEDKEAVKSNLVLLLQSYKRELYGDPYYGNNLRRFLFDQNSAAIQELIIDELFTTIQEFSPQVSLQRSDITLTIDKEVCYATIKYVYVKDRTSDMFTINLTDVEDV